MQVVFGVSRLLTQRPVANSSCHEWDHRSLWTRRFCSDIWLWCLSYPDSKVFAHEALVTQNDYPLFASFIHLGAGLACGITGLSAGYAIGIVGDSVRCFSVMLYH